ncbi:hypothetical protein HYG81_18800 [Natrinema zhouii]|uniref:hypothetical protein n=1 Tax=Natrinema zhouii TaxID=1710539 RepID=UPI001CFF58ED|nr:hypothetical protein [Natrinema zhouii]UHQ97908.1 hypothetical protein HYG81_18800 [Natrinema zhouii]
MDEDHETKPDLGIETEPFGFCENCDCIIGRELIESTSQGYVCTNCSEVASEVWFEEKTPSGHENQFIDGDEASPQQECNKCGKTIEGFSWDHDCV